MSIDVTRSIHPDLLDEYQQQIDLAAGATADAPASRRRRGRGATQSPEAETSPPGDEQAAEASVASAEGSEDASPPSEPTPPAEPEPEWLGQLKSSSDPKAMLALLTRNLPREELTRDDVLAGLLGDLSQQRARKMLEDQHKQQQDKERQAAYDRGDLYTLGQLEATNLQAQRQQLEAQTQAELNPYMVGIRNFQASLPEDVQKEVQGKNYDSYGAYLSAVQDAAIRHGVSEEVKKRSAALTKAELSATVGSEQSPELDGGPAQAYREITDAQVAAMTLEEYDRYFDDKGRPRPGVRVRLDRGININRELRR